MPSTHRLQANFTNRIGSEILLPAGVKSMFFFGTGYDGNNGNRVAGGAAPSAIGTPTYSTNYVTVGYNGTTNNTIDTMNQRTSAMLAAGWTWAAVYRCTSSGATMGDIIQDGGGGGGAIPAIGSICGMSFQSPSSLNTYIISSTQSVRATFAMPQNSGNWHFLAITYSGGAAGTHTLNEFTNNIAGGTPATYVASALAAGNNSPCLGGNVPPGATSHTYLSDIAWAMISQGPMIQADLATLAAAVRPWLARRGIVM